MASDQPWLAAAGGGTSHDVQVFQREGEYWTIVFDGTTCRIRDIRGLRHLALLLTHPHEPIAALALERDAYDDLRDVVHTSIGAHDSRERARVNVTRAIAAALKRIAAQHPALSQHLQATIRTGMFCVYTPDPRLPVRWRSRR